MDPVVIACWHHSCQAMDVMWLQQSKLRLAFPREFELEYVSDIPAAGCSHSCCSFLLLLLLPSLALRVAAAACRMMRHAGTGRSGSPRHSSLVAGSCCSQHSSWAVLSLSQQSCGEHVHKILQAVQACLTSGGPYCSTMLCRAVTRMHR
jgi:hypothetical protein